MLKVRYSSKFKKDFKIIVKRGYDISLFEEVLSLLREERTLPEKYSDHALKGDYMGHRECHITPDWLLIYKKENDMITLSLTRTGSHSDLFYQSKKMDDNFSIIHFLLYCILLIKTNHILSSRILQGRQLGGLRLRVHSGTEPLYISLIFPYLFQRGF